MEANGPSYKLCESKRRLKQNRPDTDNPPDHEQDDRQVNPNWEGSLYVLKKQVGKYLPLMVAPGQWITMASLPFRLQLPTYWQWFHKHCPWSDDLVFDHNRLITNLQPLKANGREANRLRQKEKPVSLGCSVLFTKFRRTPLNPQRYRRRRANGWLSFLFYRN